MMVVSGLTKAWPNIFFSFLLQKVCVCLPNLVDLLGARSHVCINISFAFFHAPYIYESHDSHGVISCWDNLIL